MLLLFIESGEFALFAVTDPVSRPLQWAAWLLYTAAIVVIGVLITNLSPMAAGSGIPQMRAILSGAWLHDYLSIKTLIAKWVGVVLASGSGLVIGLEGPYTHLAGLVGYAIARLPPFREIISTPALRDRMLLAAAAAGMAANFGSPVGAVLFTIEVTST